jgi:hypothetical protein
VQEKTEGQSEVSERHKNPCIHWQLPSHDRSVVAGILPYILLLWE